MDLLLCDGAQYAYVGPGFRAHRAGRQRARHAQRLQLRPPPERGTVQQPRQHLLRASRMLHCLT